LELEIRDLREQLDNERDFAVCFCNLTFSQSTYNLGTLQKSIARVYGRFAE
jgi:hypothetical protein